MRDFHTIGEHEESLWDTIVADELGSHMVPAVLYHYTNAEGLLGVLRSGTIHATDCRYLSDPSEGDLAWEFFDDILRARQRKPKDKLDETFIRCLAAMHDRSGANRPAIRDSRLFVSSFSTKWDDIGQWRMYAADGMGFCIGLDCSRLALPEQVSWAKVVYEHDDQERVVDHILRGMYYALSDLIGDVQDAQYHQFEAAACDAVNRLVVRARPFFKHSTYALEEEWRLVRYYKSHQDQKASVRSSGNRLVSYVPVPILGEDGFLPLKSIMIGPAQQDYLAHRASILDVLADARHWDSTREVEIAKSYLPYRSIR